MKRPSDTTNNLEQTQADARLDGMLAFPDSPLPAVMSGWLERVESPGPGEPYGRTRLDHGTEQETLAMRWRPGAICAPHDHGATGSGVVHLVSGTFIERRYAFDGRTLTIVGTARVTAPATIAVEPGLIHDMQCDSPGLSVHVYRPIVTAMRVYDVDKRETLVVGDDCGAWIPTDPSHIVACVPWEALGST